MAELQHFSKEIIEQAMYMHSNVLKYCGDEIRNDYCFLLDHSVDFQYINENLRNDRKFCLKFNEIPGDDYVNIQYCDEVLQNDRCFCFKLIKLKIESFLRVLFRNLRMIEKFVSMF
jgi:hypothetical protein